MSEPRESVFGDNLALLMRFFKLRQKHIAAKLGVGQETVSWWKTGRSIPPRDRRNDLCELFCELAPQLKLNADSIVLVRFTEEDIRRGMGELPNDASPKPYGSGLEELFADRNMVELLEITEKEWVVLRGIIWPEGYSPSKRAFIDILHDYRKGKSRTDRE
jgi:transcriptional regulator with XRE-family HTH domain